MGRARSRGKEKAKTQILEYPERILVDTSTYKENHRHKLKSQLQTLIQQFQKQGQTSVWLEIGMGDGTFINETAFRNPSVICIGVELKEERIYKAMLEAEKKGVQNTKYLKTSAIYLEDIFNEQQIDTIFMNFPDPWPKSKHEKHRLTSAPFLKTYHKILSNEGEFILKTDSKLFFEYTQETLVENGFKITETETDHPNDDDNIETTFESTFRVKGLPIYRLVAKKA